MKEFAALNMISGAPFAACHWHSENSHVSITGQFNHRNWHANRALLFSGGFSTDKRLCCPEGSGFGFKHRSGDWATNIDRACTGKKAIVPA
jgi:hypothetical protein